MDHTQDGNAAAHCQESLRLNPVHSERSCLSISCITKSSFSVRMASSELRQVSRSVLRSPLDDVPSPPSPALPLLPPVPLPPSPLSATDPSWRPRSSAQMTSSSSAHPVFSTRMSATSCTACVSVRRSSGSAASSALRNSSRSSRETSEISRTTNSGHSRAYSAYSSMTALASAIMRGTHAENG
jgi:hypothetical protein